MVDPFEFDNDAWIFDDDFDDDGNYVIYDFMKTYNHVPNL